MLTSSISCSPPANISSPEGTQYIALFSFVYVTSIPYLHMPGDNSIDVNGCIEKIVVVLVVANISRNPDFIKCDLPYS